ncbi:lysophospholipid acyltransferase family protein [Enterobacterales bacterium AW_CKDN230030176-1A_HGKHYDSX7]
MPGWQVALRACRLLPVLGLGSALACALMTGERLGLRVSMRRRQRWTCLFMKRLMAVLPVQVQVSGRRPTQPMLWVSNHVSWIDIPMLGTLAPLSFLSKQEVRHWPLAGWLAHRAGTLFIRRGGHEGSRLRQRITNRLQNGCPVLVFPEGTTTDGQTLRTFHGRLLGGAIEAGVPVQPVAIAYVRDGQRDTLAPFMGDDDLLSHVLRMLAHPPARVHVQILEPLVSLGRERTALAREAQQAIETALRRPIEDEQAQAAHASILTVP